MGPTTRSALLHKTGGRGRVCVCSAAWCCIDFRAGGHCPTVDLRVSFPAICGRRRQLAVCCKSKLDCQLRTIRPGIDPCHFYGIPLILQPTTSFDLSSRLLAWRVLLCSYNIHSGRLRLKEEDVAEWNSFEKLVHHLVQGATN